MLGPQADHFTGGAIETFLNTPFSATAEQDRMGLRLAGPALDHVSPSAADIVSDGVTPGAIQVPANGLPIILLADCQTVVSTPRSPRSSVPTCRALPTAHRVARSASSRSIWLLPAMPWPSSRQRWTDWACGLQTFLPPGSLDEAALYGCNLISGMVDAGGFLRGTPPDLPWECS